MSWSPIEPSEVDSLFAEYDVIELITSDAGGAIYKAVQRDGYRTVAIKLFSDDFVERTADLENRFRSDLGALSQPLVGESVVEFGKTPQGDFFLVFTYREKSDDEMPHSPHDEAASVRRTSKKKWALAGGLAAIGLGIASLFLGPREHAPSGPPGPLSPGETRRMFQPGVDHGFGEYEATRQVRIMNFLGRSTTNEQSGRIAADADGHGYPILQTLFAFDEIFGESPGQIPLGSTIHSATLRFNVTNKGHIPAFFQMATEWNAETLTFDSAKFNGNETSGIQSDDLEARVSPVSRPSHGYYGFVDVDVTDAVQSWSNGDGNFGWVLSTGGSDAWGAEGMSSSDASKRPMLTVEFGTSQAD